MNKSAIQKFSIWARTTLMEQVAQRAYQYGITKDGYGEENAVTVNGMALSSQEQSQRRELVREIQVKGYDQVMEEVAYTWFNRFIALRYMEVNNYLPSHIRVFSNSQGAFDPEILKEALHIDLPGLDQSKVAEYIEKTDNEALYRYLLLTQCNALNEGLPKMFEKMGGYTELLFPNNMLRPDSVLGRMVADIPEEDWTDQVQIIGWLYQYYITELNNQVYDGSMSKSRIPKELLSAATTIYTPDWAVRYMVENSLGRLWMERNMAQNDHDIGHWENNNWLHGKWKYYLNEAEQEPEVEAQLVVLRSQRQTLRPEDITLIDPCMGSGHILVYAFDVLMQIYESEGWSQRDAAASIVQNNLYGLDIDRRAAQLAYFAVMMKARQYDRRFLTRGIQPNLYHPGTYADGQEFGSLLIVDQLEPKPEQPDEITLFDGNYAEELNTWNFRSLLASQYDVVITNPPYLGSSRFSPALDSYVKKNYPEEKSDLSMAMFKKALSGLCKKNGFTAFITTSSWMFLSSFEKVRKFIQVSAAIDSLVDFGTELFDGKVGHNPIVAWVTRKAQINYRLTAIRLVDYCYSRRYEKEPEFFDEKNRYTAEQVNFSKIPGSRVGYWLSEKMRTQFENKPISSYADTRRGLQTGNSGTFIRKWFEVSTEKENLTPTKESKYLPDKWFLFNSGGAFRRWYGNIIDVVNWECNGKDIKNSGKAIIPSEDRYFDELISWNKISSGQMSVRYQPAGIIPGDASPFLHSVNQNHEIILYAMGILNSKIAAAIVEVLSPTLNFEVGNIAEIPVAVNENSKSQVLSHINDCIDLGKRDWNSYETSWGFKRHPLV